MKKQIKWKGIWVGVILVLFCCIPMFRVYATEGNRDATIDNVDYTFTCPVVLNSAEGFISGKRYTMSVTIVGASVDGTDATIANGWDNNTEDESFVTQ